MKRGRDDAHPAVSEAGVSGERHHEDEVLRDTLQAAVDASVEAAGRRGEEERARLLTEATAAAAKVTAEAAATKKEAEATRVQAQEMRRAVEQDRAALQAERASMEEAHTFQTTKIVLDVGGHKFTTSRQTLTSVSGTYLASMFSGRYALNPEILNPQP
jgi:hypothetical protein